MTISTMEGSSIPSMNAMRGFIRKASSACEIQTESKTHMIKAQKHVPVAGVYRPFYRQGKRY